MAGPQSWALVTGWDGGDHVVSGLDHLWTSVRLKHHTDTSHTFIHFSEIEHLPPPCRPIAIGWDALVFRQDIHPNHDYTAKFEKLLRKMADHQCKIAFVGGATGGDGTISLDEVGPTP